MFCDDEEGGSRNVNYGCGSMDLVVELRWK